MLAERARSAKEHAEPFDKRQLARIARDSGLSDSVKTLGDANRRIVWSSAARAASLLPEGERKSSLNNDWLAHSQVGRYAEGRAWQRHGTACQRRVERDLRNEANHAQFE